MSVKRGRDTRKKLLNEGTNFSKMGDKFLDILFGRIFPLEFPQFCAHLGQRKTSAKFTTTSVPHSVGV